MFHKLQTFLTFLQDFLLLQRLFDKHDSLSFQCFFSMFSGLLLSGIATFSLVLALVGNELACITKTCFHNCICIEYYNRMFSISLL